MHADRSRTPAPAHGLPFPPSLADHPSHPRSLIPPPTLPPVRPLAGLRDEVILHLVQGTEESAVVLAGVLFDQFRNHGDSNATLVTQAVLQCVYVPPAPVPG